ncbi:MAG: helix-turn-helix domain-containing protein [Sphingobium sp.]
MTDIRENPLPFSNFVDRKSTNVEDQDDFVELMAQRVRDRAVGMGYSAKSFGTAIGVKPSTAANYWIGKRPYPTETVPRIVEKLDTNVEWLFTGVDRRLSASPVVDALDAEWEQVPFYDLRNVTDTGKGEAQSWTPFRKDWLHRTLGTSFDLYLVCLLSDYHSRHGDKDLAEGDLVFCRECEPSDLVDGYIVIWRRDQGLKVARYSLRPRERVEEDVITPDEVSDDQFVPVARILGKFLQRV